MSIVLLAENPNGYCSEIIQLLEEIRSRALRNTARSAHLPAILKTQATSEQHEPALFRAELCSTSRPCNGAERHVVDASSIESKASAAFQKIRERRFISM